MHVDERLDSERALETVDLIYGRLLHISIVNAPAGWLLDFLGVRCAARSL
jgi:hypothetical protein